MPLSRLLYVSRSVLDMSRPENRTQVGELAQRAAVGNARSQLTGTLLNIGDTFVQVIEGPLAAVERTFERICCDFRHEDVKLVDLVPVTERLFPESSLAFVCAETLESPRLREELEEIRLLASVNARDAVGQIRRVLDDLNSGGGDAAPGRWN